jgi:hypothetical protein
VNADVQKYLLLLYGSAASLLVFAGYTSESVCEAVRGHRHRGLLEYNKAEK